MSDQQQVYMTDAQLERLIARVAEQPDDQAFYGPSLRERMLNAYQGDPIGRETLTVSTSVVPLVLGKDFARSALCTVTTAAIRVTFDGTPPTASVGQHFAVGEHFTIVGVAALKGFRTIREGAADGALDVEYFD